MNCSLSIADNFALQNATAVPTVGTAVAVNRSQNGQRQRVGLGFASEKAIAVILKDSPNETVDLLIKKALNNL